MTVIFIKYINQDKMSFSFISEWEDLKKCVFLHKLIVLLEYK